MPRPEQTPAAHFKGLPYGTNAVVNEQTTMADDTSESVDPSFDEFSEMPPPGPDEQFLLSPTDRPLEPVTSGMSFGEGPNAPAATVGFETKAQFASRVAQTLQAQGEMSPGVKKFVQRIERGL